MNQALWAVWSQTPGIQTIRDKCLVFKPPSLRSWYFCYSSPSRLRQMDITTMAFYISIIQVTQSITARWFLFDIVLLIRVVRPCSSSINIYWAFTMLWVFLRRKQMFTVNHYLHFTRENIRFQLGDLSNMENQAGVRRIFLNLQPVLFQGSSTIFLRLNITFFLLGYFWSIRRRCYHHIGIVWPFQR